MKFKIMQKQTINSILAGIAISIGGTASIIIKSLEFGNPITSILGALIFPFGILMISFFKLDLFTGKVHKLADPVYTRVDQIRKIRKLLWMLFINITTCVIFGFLMRFIFIGKSEVIQTVESISLTKTENLKFLESVRLLISSIFCGSLVFLSIYFSENTEDSSKIILSVLPIFIFSLCGFEHCIANPFFISFANMWSRSAVLNLLVTIIGNSIGGTLMYRLMKGRC